MSRPSNVTAPPLHSSRAHRMWSSVLLPEPLRPSMAMNSPGATVRLTLLSTWISLSPMRKVLRTPLATRMGDSVDVTFISPLFPTQGFDRVHSGCPDCGDERAQDR